MTEYINSNDICNISVKEDKKGMRWHGHGKKFQIKNLSKFREKRFKEKLYSNLFSDLHNIM